MASITINVPDEQAARVLNGFAYHHGYREQIRNPDYDPAADPPTPETIPNPQSKLEFLRQGLVRHVRDSVRQAEQALAMIAARDAVSDVDGID